MAELGNRISHHLFYAPLTESGFYPVIRNGVENGGSSPSGSANKENEMQYKIVKGDTLSQLAKTHGVTVTDIMEANPKISNRDKIYAGDTIEIPYVTVTAAKSTLKKWWDWYVNLFRFGK